MAQQRIKAAFIRGGTSKGVFFHTHDLPSDIAERDTLLLKVLGSPDPYQRQLNGMGGGISSLSKAVIIAPSERDDADVDYTFLQIGIDSNEIDESSNCGNLSSAVGPFAVDEGLLKVEDGIAQVRVFNTNTETYFLSEFECENGKATVKGDLFIPGIADSGAKIKLSFLTPGGATTGQVLPTGNVLDEIHIPDFGKLKLSLVDVSNAVVFVAAEDLNVDISLTPDELEQDKPLMHKLETIRCHAAVKMGLAKRIDDVSLANPKIAIIDKPKTFTSLANTTYDENSHHLAVRIISLQRVHKAITLTGAMCLASAVKLTDSIAHSLSAQPNADDCLIANPSGVLPINANVVDHNISSVTVYRTQRRLMDGYVYINHD